MFPWLVKFFSKKTSTDILELHTPKERLIFNYWDGFKNRSADPLVLYKKVMDIGPELSVDIKVANSASKDAGKDYTSVVEKIRNIFDVVAYNEVTKEGLTELETSVLFDQFMIFCGQIKKKSKSYQTSSDATPETSKA